MLPLKAVFFDKDGVLADTEPHTARAYVLAFASFGLTIEAGQFRREVQLGGKRVGDWFNQLGGAAPLSELYAAKDRIYGEIIGGREEPREGLRDRFSGILGMEDVKPSSPTPRCI